MSSAQLQLLPILLVVLVLSTTLHELAHAAVAYLLGDRTAQRMGRLTLNPVKHLDPIGSAVFVFSYLLGGVLFGWAKPVPVYPKNFRHPARGMALVAIAGPIVNVLIALGIAAALVHVVHTDRPLVVEALMLAISLNVVLAVFNLIPVPPLDGSRIVGAFMPEAVYEQWTKFDQYAPLFLLAILFLPGLSGPFQVLLASGREHVLELIFRIV